MAITARLTAQIDPQSWQHEGLSPFNKFICFAIILSTFMAIVETEPVLTQGYPQVFFWLNILFLVIFSIELLLRIYIAPYSHNHPGINRLRFMISPWTLLDILVLLTFMPVSEDLPLLIIRLIRVFRIIRVSRLTRFNHSLSLLFNSVNKRKTELSISFLIAMVLLLVTSILLYLVEGTSNPESFGSIPRAMWWSIATLTTVGYGDVTPLSPIGKFCAGITALIGIGIVAMPTGILAAAFSEAYQQAKEEKIHHN
ncbi:potassium transporter Kef [Alishewanella longhuensis]|uniref:Potassium transporter Kef n=1 Tax=Alishewanella longhuensis TaxID=1091037 RepID=A0ABQ3L124_9ALTE|nr:ion transporter [Alishewanella longhuensis]GHG69849.1 potassium transporter Kef [Alishewanella longhuensis]